MAPEGKTFPYSGTPESDKDPYSGTETVKGTEGRLSEGPWILPETLVGRPPTSTHALSTRPVPSPVG